MNENMRLTLNHTKRYHFLFFVWLFMLASCSKKDGGQTAPPPANFQIQAWKVHSQVSKEVNYDIPVKPLIELTFSTPISRSSAGSAITLKNASGAVIPTKTGFLNGDNTISISTDAPLEHITRYEIIVSTSLKSAAGGSLTAAPSISFFTSIDSTRKFPVISDDSLLTLVQKQTFKYFWDFAHPVSGLARERNTSGDLVTSGGSGFGIMAIISGIHRGFITKEQGLTRLRTIVSFLKNTAQTFHGAFPHWLSGTTGAVIPFSNVDNGADLVETSYLVQGLLTARQYFAGNNEAETTLRSDINHIWQKVEWDWFRRGGQNTLFWHWSPGNQWAINMQIRGWNEALITYVLAASSPTFQIPKSVYDNGWALNGGMQNGKPFYSIPLPLGPDFGGPLFFAHYSFLGINPNSLSDAYASYFTQNKNHTLINYQHSIANPKGFYGYSDSTWGLTASDIPNGYTASSPTNDIGVIAPTAALSSFPYTPVESMKALKFFYYVLGDKIWKEYGFVDAFSLKDAWFANSFLAIDQGPIIIMIENHRSGLLWNLFMSCPEVKTGMKALGFQSPHL